MSAGCCRPPSARGLPNWSVPHRVPWCCPSRAMPASPSKTPHKQRVLCCWCHGQRFLKVSCAAARGDVWASAALFCPTPRVSWLSAACPFGSPPGDCDLSKKLWQAQEAGAAAVLLFPSTGRDTYAVPSQGEDAKGTGAWNQPAHQVLAVSDSRSTASPPASRTQVRLPPPSLSCPSLAQSASSCCGGLQVSALTEHSSAAQPTATAASRRAEHIRRCCCAGGDHLSLSFSLPPNTTSTIDNIAVYSSRGEPACCTAVEAWDGGGLPSWLQAPPVEPTLPPQAPRPRTSASSPTSWRPGTSSRPPWAY